MMANKNNREIPKKNYFIVLVVSILVIIVTLYIRTFYLSYKATNSNTSVFFDKNINQINEKDIDFALSETNEAILYISYNGSSKINNMEKRLYKEIENKNLVDKMIYWNVSEYQDEIEYIKMLRNKFPTIAERINKAPMLIYINEGEAVDVIDSSEGMINYNSLNDLLLKYGIE